TWNQASSTFPAAIGGSGGSSGGNPKVIMAQTTGPFASHARSASIANSPSAHRRAGGGVGPAQHASPSNNPSFPRPFANAAFPGTVSAPRSAAAPNSALAPPKSIQHLSLLTTHTPTSIAKLAFPPHTTVFWHRLQKICDDAASTAGHDHQRQDAATSSTTASAGSSQELNKAWDNGVQRLLSSLHPSRLRTHAIDESHRKDCTAFQLLLKDPLIYTISKGHPSGNNAPSASGTSEAELWVFVVVTDQEELRDKDTSDSDVEAVETGAAHPGNRDAAAGESAQVTTRGDSTLLDLTLARHLSADLAKSLARLSTSAHATSGSYRLSAAATNSIDGKGKQSSLTSQQRQAHRRFMASLKAKIIDSFAGAQPPSSKHKRDRLRLRDSVVFLPTSQSGSRSTATPDASWFAAPGLHKASFSGVTNSPCLLTQLVISLTATSLFVHATSRPLAALPLIDTRHANTASSLASSPVRPTMLIAPLGSRVELMGIVPMSGIANEHLTELCQSFAVFNSASQHTEPNGQSPFAAGVAICAFSRPTSCPQSQQQEPHLQDPQQLTDASLIPSAQRGTSDQGMPLAATTGVADERANANARDEGLLQFLWPAAWCLVVQEQASTSTGALGLGSNAMNDLKSMQSQPLTPLKELVSFTLKVLNDANESALAQSTAPYAPGEPDEASIARHRADRMPSTRADITPASMSFADFDFAMPIASSATPSHALPTAGQSVPPGASPLKREPASTEPVQAANSTEAFGQDLNWMHFLSPQISDAAVSSSEPAFALQIDSTSMPAPTSGADPAVNATAMETDGAKHSHADQSGSNWLVSSGSSTAPEGGQTAAAQSSDPAASQSLLQPHPHLQSHGPTLLQGQQETSPLGFTHPTSSKRKPGEGDIFGNLGLLTEDDFSFFDESAFGLDPEGELPRHMEQPAETIRMGPSQHHLAYAQPRAVENHSTAPGPSMPAETRPASSIAAAVIDDVTMDDVGQSSLDALFSAIPGLQDAMVSSETSQAPTAPLQSSLAASTAVTQPAPSRLGHSAAQDLAVSAHAFHPAMSSFTPRDASGATPFGDPASLPGFTPSSLTESSPTFGHPHYKTPRTPCSPVEEYRDGATIVDLHNGHRMGESAQSYRDRNAASAPDLHAPDQHQLSGYKADSFLHDDQLHLADASTAAAAAANAAMDTDASSRKRPAIVPNAFLPLRLPEARKPLQKLAAGARTNLGRKYDSLGKFASRPKTATATATAKTTVLNASNATTTAEHPSSGNTGKGAERMDRQSFSETGRLGTRYPATRPSSSKMPSLRGEALLQLRRDRHGKSSPGLALNSLGRSSSSRVAEAPATPRSSDDVVLSGAMSASGSDTSGSEDDDSDDALSDSEATALTLSPQDQATLKDVSLDVVASYLCGASYVSRAHWPAGSSAAAEQTNEDPATLRSLVKPPLPFSRFTQTALIAGSTATSISSRPTLRRWMLSRTAAWLIENPQFRSMYGMLGIGSMASSELAIGDKIEVLETMASALSIAPVLTSTSEPAETSTASTSFEAEVALPKLRDLVRPSKHVAGVAADSVEVAEVLEPTRIAAGCQGSVVEALPSSLTLWDKSKLSAVSGQKHVVAKVLLTDASPAWHEEIVAWLERLRVTFETHGLGTHVSNAQSILAVADGSESLALSSCLDQFWQDGETWLDTLRSISSRVELDLLQGKHVVVYTLQPPNSAACASTGFRGLLRLEADLRAMVSEQVGVLAEQLLVRAVSPSMMTESGSLGFGQQSQTLRRLAFSVYDQLPRLVRRQPAKVLHGREAGPISAAVQFPSFSLSTASASGTCTAGQTNLSLSWPLEPAAALDEHVLLHVSYRVCQTGSREQAEQAGGTSRNDGSAPFVGANVFGLGGLADGDQAASTRTRERIVLVSAIDERGGSSTVDALAANDSESSIEACVERVWRFALAEASRARVRWRLAISSAVVMGQRELVAWQRMIGSYVASTRAEERVMGSVVLLSVRPDESGAVVAERGGRTKPSQPWAATAEKSSLVLLDAADFSQMVKFAEPMPMGWTQAVAESQMVAEEEEQEEVVEEGDEKDAMALPIASAMLVHRSRPDLLSSNTTNMHRLDGGASASQVLAVDMLYRWSRSTAQQHGSGKEEADQVEAMDAILRSLHRLRLLSEERHQLPWPYTAQPWSVASVNTLAACLEGVVLGD
ncbi:uncharacterized protein SPSC_03765, partial [Sporisorium scitamineum]